MSTNFVEYPSADRRLDWVSEHDVRSLAYPFMSGAPGDVPRAWRPGAVLDQGEDGSCVGHGWVAELIASPRPYVTTPWRGHEYAVELYHSARELDEWPGEGYEGTSVLAGAKAVQQAGGFIGGYRWALGINRVRDAIITEGPVVIGIPWMETMFRPPSNRLLDISGDVAGGHCLLVYGYHPGLRVHGEAEPVRCFRLRNSWGTSWGRNGNALIRYEDLRDLLKTNGEACVPEGRRQVKF